MRNEINPHPLITDAHLATNSVSANIMNIGVVVQSSILFIAKTHLCLLAIFILPAR